MMHPSKKKENSSPAVNAGFEKLMNHLPRKANNFKGSEFPRPVAMAYFGKKAKVEDVRRQAEQLRTAPPAGMCEIAMVMAEIIEGTSPDHDKYFQTDAKTRGYVFGGSKWRAGWVFLMGDSDHSELAQKFTDRSFQLFGQNVSGLKNMVDLGPRETAAVYFLQIMVRYAMIWGGIKPGDDHEMGHFLEKDMPGVVVAHGKLTPVEELLLLGLMKMGAPAVVPLDYPWDLGRQVRAENVEQIVEAATRFPNLRVKDIQGKIIELPVFCNPANIKDEFVPATTIGGRDSFFILRPGNVEDGMAIPLNKDLGEANPIGIIIEIGDRRLDVVTSDYIEKDALKGISTIVGLRAEQSQNEGFVIKTASGVKADAARIAEAVQKWTRFEFPYLENIHVKIVTGAEAKKAKAEAEKFRTERQKLIEEESEENARNFNYCIECQPFSKDHVCIITPDRPPMCGRDRFQVKAAALFGATWHPWKRQELQGQELRGAIAVGKPVDAAKGEYEEVNLAVEKLSPSHFKRVHLHGLREYPHTSCGCFQFLVFWIESLNGMGIMERDYQGTAPGGITWNFLANSAGGKQTPGVVGVSRNYLRSKKFMQGEGGLKTVRWVSPRAFEAIKDLLLDPENVEVGK